MSPWIKMSDRYPEVIIDEDGGCNAVLAYFRKAPCGSGHEHVSNTLFVVNNPGHISHWMELPPKPKD